MFRIFTNDHYTAFAFDDLALVAHLFDGRSDLHLGSSLLTCNDR
ncbi:Uncharacterised protein [Bacteroides xylanisolvens]|nr:Uncharacterised protein [Bacteroides xylanisolvens]